MQFGWKAGTEQYPPEELLEYALAAEKAGFDFVSASDHFHPWSEQGQACFVWSWLGALAAQSKTISMGTGVTCPILRYSPSIVAQAAATIASFAPGRFFLGVGTGEALNEYSASGEWPEYETRQRQLREAIELIRRLWSGDEITHEGTYYQTRKAKLYTRPKKPIPIFISSMVPNSAYFAGRHGDGLITTGGEEPEVYREMFKNFGEGAKEAKRNISKVPKMIELAVAYTDDEEKAIQYRKNFWAGTYIPALFTERIYTSKASEENGKPVGPDTIKKSVCISGDPESHIKLAKHYIDLGFDHLVFHSAGPDQHAFIKAYGKEILPRLRQFSSSKRKAA